MCFRTNRGKILPKLINPEATKLLEIAEELARLIDLASKSKLSTNDLTGGTFTLSNVGAIGGTYTSPLIVVPEVCIGAMGK